MSVEIAFPAERRHGGRRTTNSTVSTGWSQFFSYGGKEYLAYVDLASGWVSIVCLNRNGVSSIEMLPYVRKFFVEYGIPEKFESDGGPQFSLNDFQSFLRKWGVQWRPSAPYYTQSNGLAESAVKN